jgi:hypothetical protein
MLLDFTNPVLDPRITFSRGTNATLVDSTGRIAYAPANLVVRSEEFDNASWVKANSTVTANAGIAPDGTLTADALIPTNSTSIHRIGQGVGASRLTTAVISVYAKANGYNKVAILDPQHTAAGSALVDLRDGTTANIANTVGTTVVTGVGNGWYRISWTFSGYPSGALDYQAAITPAPDSGFTNSNSSTFTGNGVDGILIWGAQFEPQTYSAPAAAYVATTASVYYGPRFDYDPVTLAPRGLLIEEARTNLLLRSEEFDNASWVKTTFTVTANATPSPNGTSSADLITQGGGGSTQEINQVFTGTAVAHTMTIYVKKGTRRFAVLALTPNATPNIADYAWFDLDTGARGSVGANVTSSSIVAVGSGWYRIAITRTLAASTHRALVTHSDADNSLLSTGGSISYLWGAQLEAAAFATSYLPTVASTVSRSADVASMTGTNFSTWYNQAAGTFVMDGDTAKPTTLVATAQILSASDGTVNNNHRVRFITAGIDAVTSVGGVTQVDMTEVGYVVNVPSKVAYGYLLNDYGFTVNGGTVQTDTSATVPTVNSLQLGSDPTGFGQINGHLRAIAYYNTRLPNTQLQTLTAPSLASPLALDFISPTYTVGY